MIRLPHQPSESGSGGYYLPRQGGHPYVVPGYEATPPVPAGTVMGTPGFAPVPMPPSPAVPGMLPLEQSYIENILRLNRGKVATIYMTFENNEEWNAKVFRGRIEAAGRDHIIISDPESGKRYLLLMVNLDYITFDEELQYTYPYAAANSYPPVNPYGSR